MFTRHANFFRVPVRRSPAPSDTLILKQLSQNACGSHWPLSCFDLALDGGRTIVSEVVMGGCGWNGRIAGAFGAAPGHVRVERTPRCRRRRTHHLVREASRQRVVGWDEELPILSVLNDTLVGSERGDDRFRQVWVYTLSPPSLRQRLLCDSVFLPPPRDSRERRIKAASARVRYGHSFARHLSRHPDGGGRSSGHKSGGSACAIDHPVLTRAILANTDDSH